MARPKTRPKPAPQRTADLPSGNERLQKVLAAAGVGSRRECEELIRERRVEVDNQIVDELGSRVDPTSQRIRVDGVALPQPKRAYFVVNKPAGVVCTNRDPGGRMRVVDLIRSDERLFTVGRLDRSSEGLILVTNDGELSNQLTHPRYGIEKVYRVRVAGHPTPEILGKLRRGVRLSDGIAKVAKIRIKRRQKAHTDLEIVLDEGRNREIRRLLARVGHKVLNLTRIAMGPIKLADLPTGAHRELSRDEVQALRRAIRAKQGRGKAASRDNQPQATAAKPKAISRRATAPRPAGATARGGKPQKRGPKKPHGVRKTSGKGRR